MNDLNKDTNTLITDFFNILERYMVIAWNGLMHLFIGIKIMPLFGRYPKFLAALIVLMCFVTPPITIFWIAIGFTALNNQIYMNENFIIDRYRHDPEEDENEAKVFRDELALRLHGEGIDNPVYAANKVTEAQFGKPIDELINKDDSS